MRECYKFAWTPFTSLTIQKLKNFLKISIIVIMYVRNQYNYSGKILPNQLLIELRLYYNMKCFKNML